MVTSRTVEEVMSLLKKDLIKTVEEDYEKVTPATTGRAHIRTTSTVNYSSTQFMPVQSDTRK